jgi:hypothetical protein
VIEAISKSKAQGRYSSGYQDLLGMELTGIGEIRLTSSFLPFTELTQKEYRAVQNINPNRQHEIHELAHHGNVHV